MARMVVNGFEEIEKMMKDLEKPEKAAKKAVDAALPVLLRSTQSAVSAAANKGYATGGLAGSFYYMKAKQNERGVFGVVKPGGNDPKGNSYAARATFLEYGTKRGNAASPWRQAAVNNARRQVESIIEKTVDEEIGRITGG